MLLVKRIKANSFKIIFTQDFKAQLKKIETSIDKLLTAWFRESDTVVVHESIRKWYNWSSGLNSKSNLSHLD